MEENEVGANEISICDIMKSSTSEIIKKTESKIPSYVQLYSDFYKEYLHSLDDVFGTCYIAEKEYFEKLGFDQRTLRMFESYWKQWTAQYSLQIDTSTNYLKNSMQMQISAMKTTDKFIHQMMDGYAKALSMFNSNLKK